MFSSHLKPNLSFFSYIYFCRLQMLSIWTKLEFVLCRALMKQQIERDCRQQFHIRWKWQKFSEGVENTLGRGGNACYEQFLLFPLCFQNDLYCRHVKTRTCLAKTWYCFHSYTPPLPQHLLFRYRKWRPTTEKTCGRHRYRCSFKTSQENAWKTCRGVTSPYTQLEKLCLRF